MLCVHWSYDLPLLNKIDPNPQHLKKRISIETRFFTKCIRINLYLSSSAKYLRYTERLYGQMRRILL